MMLFILKRFVLRFENFQKKDEFIGKHNNNPKTLAKLGHNDYSYMSHEEINSKLKGFRVNGFNIIKKRGIGSAINTYFNGAKINLPFYYYVSTKGYTAPVSVGLLLEISYNILLNIYFQN